MRPIEAWLSPADLESLYSAAYWNDIETERTKEWWIEDGDYERCHRYLHESKLMLEHQQAEAWVRELKRKNLRVLDIAAGIGWTSALLTKLDSVAEVHAVEISQHRLERLFPHAVKMFAAQEQKIFRYLGSFYDLKLPSASMDVIYLSQAFHHADRPLHLLVECDRVLKTGGRLVLTGEPRVTGGNVIRRFLGSLLKRRKVVVSFHELFPHDKESGDHYYRRADYQFMLRTMGYDAVHHVLGSGNSGYVADKTAHGSG